MPQCIDQRQIPATSRLVADYLYDFDRVGRWYGAGLAPFQPSALAAAAQAVSYPLERRHRVADRLEESYRGLKAGAATQEMLARFREPNCVAIVSGQQVGLLGGPLLTLYKALTAIRLAADLRTQGVNAVPVFWLASQDHDLAEINHAYVLDSGSRPQRIEAASHGRTGREPVGRVALGPEIESTLRAFAAASGHDATAIASLRTCYRPEATFASAFRSLMAGWFEPWGLLLFDPLDAGLATEAQETLGRVVAQAESLTQALAQRSHELEAAGYHAQVSVSVGDGAALLFGEREGERLALRRRGQAWLWGEAELSEAELVRQMNQAPERFSPAALLRPVVQDVLLPTAVQVAGPAETAYLAQSAVLYRELGQRQPLIHPRASATLMDARTRRLLDKYGLSLPALWDMPPSSQPEEALAAVLARQNLPPDLERALAEMRSGTEKAFAALTAQIAALDSTLVDFTTTAGSKIRHQLEQIESRVARGLARRQADLRRHAETLSGTLYPERNLQERILNSADWILRYSSSDQDEAGAGLLTRLHGLIATNCPDHQLIDV